jgi:predicted DNA-binding transcriptional regulator AlpA
VHQRMTAAVGTHPTSDRSDTMPVPNLKPTMARKPSKPQATLSGALAIFNDLPDCGFVRLPVVAALYGVGPATIWRWVKSGRIRPPKKLGPNTSGFNVGELRRSMGVAAEEQSMAAHSHFGATALGLVTPKSDGRDTVEAVAPLDFAEDSCKDFHATPQAGHTLRMIEGEGIAREYLARLQAQQADSDELALIVAKLYGATLTGFCRAIVKALGGSA